MTDILTQTAVALREMAETNPDRLAEVKAAYDTPGLRARTYLTGRGIPYPVLSALPAEIADALAEAFHEHAPNHVGQTL